MGHKNATAASEPPDENEGAAGSSSDGFEQPLPDPEVVAGEAADPAASVEGTAALGVKLMSIGCTMKWQSPLTNPEAEELHRDLAAVLVKYDAPDIPFVEEFTLVANVGGIVFRRVAAEQQARARVLHEQAQAAQEPPPPPPPQGVPGNDLFGAGKEGNGQNGGHTQARSTRPGGEAGDLLS